MLQAIRSTVRGTDSLLLWLDGHDAYVNQTRRWTPTQRAITLLALIQDDDDNSWIFIRDVISRLKLENECWDDESFTAVISSLERDGMIDVFREITDSTHLKCVVGQWTFWTQWTVLRKQISVDMKNAAQELLTNGTAIIDGDPPIKVTLR